MAKIKFLLIIGLVAFIQLGANAQSKSGKRVQPLYWLNPNNYVYREINAPKHMKLPKVVLPDADNDNYKLICNTNLHT